MPRRAGRRSNCRSRPHAVAPAARRALLPSGATPRHHDATGHPFEGGAIPSLWIALTDVGPDDAPHDYPFGARLAALDLPVLVLTAERDPLVTAHEPLLAHAHRGRGRVFAGSHPLHDPARAGEYARAVTAGLRELGVGMGETLNEPTCRADPTLGSQSPND